MNRLLFGAASLAALLAAGSAFAAGNASTIDQIGYANNASVDQTGSPSDAIATITQGAGNGSADAYNLANVTQGGGAGNQASITQSQGGYGAVSNPSNTSNSDQQGADGTVTVVQVGDNTSAISQLNGSSHEYALVGQTDYRNNSSIEQGGVEELAVVNQEEGTGNSASIVQSGVGNGFTVPGPTPNLSYPNVAQGPGNLFWDENVPNDSALPYATVGYTRYGPTGAVVDQVGSNNVGNVNQQGYQNFADVSQENDSAPGGNTGSVSQGSALYQSDGVMYQYGQYNTASINQSGSGSTYSTVWQNGNFNQGYSTQVGSEHSVIEQGVTNDFANPETDFSNPQVTADYASVDQTQGNDTSTVTQLGNNDTAYVAQTSTANATSVINQGGSYNVASVRQ